MEKPISTDTSTAPGRQESLQTLARQFLTDARRKGVLRAVELARKGSEVHLGGLAGSSPAMLFGGLALHQPAGTPALLVTDSMDDAGYLYNDLVKILGENAVMIFPSARTKCCFSLPATNAT